MKFNYHEFPEVNGYLPVGLRLELPLHTTLELSKQHFLLQIPWNEKLLDKVPTDLKPFFIKVLPYLKVRTTNVHVAICLEFLEEFVTAFKLSSLARKRLGLAFILHDVGWSQLSEAEIAASLGVKGLSLNKDAIAPKERHAVVGEKLARELLKEDQVLLGLSDEDIELIVLAVRFHDQPELVAGKSEPMPIEVQALVDLDHLWSFTFENFWQDTLRKGIKPLVYLENLLQDLPTYFVTKFGKTKALSLWQERAQEVEELLSHLQ